MDFSHLEQTIDKYRNDFIELQRLLTAIPALAPESDGDGEAKKAAALKDYLKRAGFPEPKEYNAPDERVSTKSRPNLVYIIEGQDKSRTVWVMSHTDIVPPGDLAKWKSDPYELIVDGDRIIGRGVEDTSMGWWPRYSRLRRLSILRPSPNTTSGCCLWPMRKSAPIMVSTTCLSIMIYLKKKI